MNFCRLLLRLFLFIFLQVRFADVWFEDPDDEKPATGDFFKWVGFYKPTIMPCQAGDRRFYQLDAYWGLEVMLMKAVPATKGRRWVVLKPDWTMGIASPVGNGSSLTEYPLPQIRYTNMTALTGDQMADQMRQAQARIDQGDTEPDMPKYWPGQEQEAQVRVAWRVLSWVWLAPTELMRYGRFCLRSKWRTTGLVSLVLLALFTYHESGMG